MRKEMNKLTGIEDVILETIAEADMGDLRMPVIGIYKNPDDYPDKYVARIFDGGQASNTVVLSDSLEELMKDIDQTEMFFIERGKEDVPALVGAYM